MCTSHFSPCASMYHTYRPPCGLPQLLEMSDISLPPLPQSPSCWVSNSDSNCHDDSDNEDTEEEISSGGEDEDHDLGDFGDEVCTVCDVHTAAVVQGPYRPGCLEK